MSCGCQNCANFHEATRTRDDALQTLKVAGHDLSLWHGRIDWLNRQLDDGYIEFALQLARLLRDDVLTCVGQSRRRAVVITTA